MNTISILKIARVESTTKKAGWKHHGAIMKEAFSSQYNSVKLSVQDNNIRGYSFRCNLGFKVTKKCDCDNFCNLSMELKRYLKH